LVAVFILNTRSIADSSLFARKYRCKQGNNRRALEERQPVSVDSAWICSPWCDLDALRTKSLSGLIGTPEYFVWQNA